jgi:hypothetical protein
MQLCREYSEMNWARNICSSVTNQSLDWKLWKWDWYRAGISDVHEEPQLSYCFCKDAWGTTNPLKHGIGCIVAVAPEPNRVVLVSSNVLDHTVTPSHFPLFPTVWEKRSDMKRSATCAARKAPHAVICSWRGHGKPSLQSNSPFLLTVVPSCSAAFWWLL